MKREARIKRHSKIRKSVTGTKEHPRLSVFRSNQHLFAQIIDDTKNHTLLSVSDSKEQGTKMEKAYKAGKKLAEKALKQKIAKVVFDRGGFLYHGRIAEFGRGAREGGLKF